MISKFLKFKHHLAILVLLNPHCNLFYFIINRPFNQLKTWLLILSIILLQLIIQPQPFSYIIILINQIAFTLPQPLIKPSFEPRPITTDHLALSFIPIIFKLAQIFAIILANIIAITTHHIITPLSNIFISILILHFPIPLPSIIIKLPYILPIIIALLSIPFSTYHIITPLSIILISIIIFHLPISIFIPIIPLSTILISIHIPHLPISIHFIIVPLSNV